MFTSLIGPKLLEIISSKYSKEISVYWSLAFGKYMQVDGLTQSGGIINSIWESTIKKVSKLNPQIKTCLVLGLGGGTVVNIIKNKWRDVLITGVDIDKDIVELGIKHELFNKSDCKIIISDALKLLKRNNNEGIKKYDLIIVDTYNGYNYPSEFETVDFIELVKNKLSLGGTAVFNRLYFGTKRPLAVKFGNKAEKIFSEVDWYYPEANLMLICSN